MNMEWRAIRLLWNSRIAKTHVIMDGEDICYIDLSHHAPPFFLLKNGNIYNCMRNMTNRMLDKCNGRSLKFIASEITRSIFEEKLVADLIFVMTVNFDRSSLWVTLGNKPINVIADFIVSVLRHRVQPTYNSAALVRQIVRQVLGLMITSARKEMRVLEGGEKMINESIDSLNEFMAKNMDIGERVEEFDGYVPQ
ncbi:unnamed protein product [Caenorhabditis angaria]|uniref:Uncharacterized protein n=1 Tax=Caenorhabditis angaria TaxID=860376 RepID=A0A9P1IU39_9PELO|nr:unnamed protein product [Caenorhabditis angaria]